MTSASVDNDNNFQINYIEVYLYLVYFSKIMEN